METYLTTILKASIFVVVISSISCTITITTPAGGDAVATNAIAEGSTSGAVETIVATTAFGGSVNAFALVVASTNFEFASSSAGDLTVKSTATLDYESATSITITFTASDGSSTGSGTLTISITDINDNTPAFSSIVAAGSVTGGSGANTVVGSVTVTDADGTAANNVITYAITDGNTNDMFKISSAGEVSVNTDKTLGDSGSYGLTITATDSGTTPSSLTATGYFGVAVCASGASTASASGIAMAAITLMAFLYKFL